MRILSEKLVQAYAAAYETKPCADYDCAGGLLILGDIPESTPLQSIHNIVMAIYDYSQANPEFESIFVQNRLHTHDGWRLTIASEKPFDAEKLLPALQAIVQKEVDKPKIAAANRQRVNTLG